MGENFGEFLKKLREDRKMSLYDVEREVKISNAYLSQVERGIRNTPSLKQLAKLAKAYGVPLSVLTEKANEELQGKESTSKKGLPAPDINFICRGYEKLSEDNKKMLKKFLNTLQNEEKGKK